MRTKTKKEIDKTRHKITRNILTVTLIGLGILLFIGTFIELPAFTILKEYQPSLHKINEAIFYSSISILCIALGLERASDLFQIDNTLNILTKSLNDIEDHLKNFKQFYFLKEYEDIYRASIKIAEKTKTKIRAIVYTNQPKAPDWWNEKIAKILKEKSDNGKPIQFDLVICVKPTDINLNFFKVGDKRFEIYEKMEISQFFHRYILVMEKLIGQDCLIIDDEHFIINFPTIQSNKTQKGILFENQSEVTKELINWYDSFAHEDVITYERLKSDFENKIK